MTKAGTAIVSECPSGFFASTNYFSVRAALVVTSND
jgi:hypothetical protein